MGAFILARVFLGFGSSWNHILDWAGMGTYCVCLLIGVLSYSPQGDQVGRPSSDAARADLEALAQANAG
ncbi:MAG: hypothetical protein R2724_30250 [Bryobacterales bacterium]